MYKIILFLGRISRVFLRDLKESTTLKPFYKNLRLRQDWLCFIGLYSKELMTSELEGTAPKSSESSLYNGSTVLINPPAGKHSFFWLCIRSLMSVNY